MTKTPDPDWSLMQSFLAVAEGGSLSAAARKTGQSQPTLGRQIRQLEQDLDSNLFTRHARGLELTDEGHAILSAAQQMREAMKQIELTVAGRESDLSGTVRVTASEIVSQHLLPPILAQLRRDYPMIGIDLIATDDTENLLFREADVAVRMFRPEQLDIVTRQLGNIQIGVCAARSYLDLHGRPKTLEDLSEHSLLGYDKSELILRGMHELGIPASRDWFTIRCDDQNAYWQLLRAGCGIGFSQKVLIDRAPEVELLDLGIPIPSLPVWLAAPQATRRTPRVSAVWKVLETGLLPFVS
ncbi:LysR family transcriptional regulator [Thalassovita sp.]|jgi:DNA-binding transcriptional LysR family regulator|uniref:LysR family transcriptional regulator n=1 Tax=Thalassovita sp. TaxID=1979401 RepID=UPI003B5B17A9